MTLAPRAGDGTVLFLHIPKTAGSTLGEVLMRQHRPRSAVSAEVGLDGGEDRQTAMVAATNRGEHHDPITVDALNGLAAERLREGGARRLADARLVMGHFAYGLHEVVPPPAWYVTVIREPVDRALSLYQHRVRHHGLQASLEGWLRSGNDPCGDDAQTRRIAGPAPAGADLGALATDHLTAPWMVFGVTERFDDLMLLLADATGWRDLSYERRNVTSNRLHRHDVSPAVIALIKERNALDVELHALAVEEQVRRLADAGLDGRRGQELRDEIERERRAFDRRRAPRRVARRVKVRVRLLARHSRQRLR